MIFFNNNNNKGSFLYFFYFIIYFIIKIKIYNRENAIIKIKEIFEINNS